MKPGEWEIWNYPSGNVVVVQGARIISPFGFSSLNDWLSHFEKQFPDKAKKMQKYSEAKGWGKGRHQDNWLPVCLGWVTKQVDSDLRGTRHA